MEPTDLFHDDIVNWLHDNDNTPDMNIHVAAEIEALMKLSGSELFGSVLNNERTDSTPHHGSSSCCLHWRGL